MFCQNWAEIATIIMSITNFLLLIMMFERAQMVAKVKELQDAKLNMKF